MTRKINYNLKDMSKLIIITFISLSCFIGEAKAVPSDSFCLVVTLQDGSVQKYLLSSQPSVLFQEDQFVITPNGSNIEFSVSNVKSFSFDTKSGIQSAKNDGLVVSFTDQENLVISGAKADLQIGITDMEGKKQPCAIERQSDNVLALSLKGLHPGIYIISIGRQQNLKVVKK